MSTATAAAQTTLPPLDPGAMREVLSGLPNSKATAALVYVGTPTDSWMGASGVADIASNAPARADGRFRIGSITKVFTAAQDQNLLGLNIGMAAFGIK
ncbi:serine hydrolase [Paenibacillus allorhizosphaerae]|uniref:beta-lactamase family protein n=1 Tax=Paenibacillus allorhizosphaerae TaxID=2849866 RepID=UPI001E45C897|nr:beta-lactamase family protein [Paenibacillus allorhizosphaerae]